MSAIETTTDMATFEGALDEWVCHLFTGAQMSVCGQVRREEQPPHPYPRGTPASARYAPFCHCGLPRCRACSR